MQQEDYETYNSNDASRQSQSSLPAIASATELMMASLDKVSTMSSDIDDMVHAIANMRVAVKQIDAQLDAFKAATGAKLDKFKLQVPILDKQMDKISDRIDKITDKILSLTDDDMSEQTLKKQSVLMDALSNFNDSFNNLVMRLMEF